MAYKQYNKNRPYWQERTLNMLPEEYLLSVDDILQLNFHYGNYAYFRHQIQKCLNTESLILERFHSYYFNRIDIRLKTIIRANDSQGRNSVEFLKQQLRKIDNCIRSNGLYDRLLGTILKYEIGHKRKRWHIHMYCFWRGDIPVKEHDRCLLELKRFIDNLCPELDCWCIFDADIGIGSVSDTSFKERNQVRTLLSYICKIRIPSIGVSLGKIVEDWSDDEKWEIKDILGMEINRQHRCFSCRVRESGLVSLSEIRDYPRLKGTTEILEAYQRAKTCLQRLRQEKTIRDRQEQNVVFHGYSGENINKMLEDYFQSMTLVED